MVNHVSGIRPGARSSLRRALRPAVFLKAFSLEILTTAGPWSDDQQSLGVSKNPDDRERDFCSYPAGFDHTHS